jgi:hypothetical protein
MNSSESGIGSMAAEVNKKILRMEEITHISKPLIFLFSVVSFCFPYLYGSLKIVVSDRSVVEYLSEYSPFCNVQVARIAAFHESEASKLNMCYQVRNLFWRF